MADVTPYLSVRDAAAAIDFYQQAFGARLVDPALTDPQGQVMHAELDFDGSRVMLASENEAWENWSPEKLGGTPVRLNLQVDDARALFDQAVAAGATVLIALDKQFYGHLSGRLQDPFGHVWIVSEELEAITHEEMQRRADALFAGE